MSDFRARILAELDDSKIPSQLNKIAKNNTLTLSNIRLDTSRLPSQIQASIDKHSFTINLEGIKTKNIDNQIDLIGKKFVGDITAAYQEMLRVQRQMGSIKLQIGGLDTTKNSAHIEELTRQLDELTAQYDHLYSTFGKDLSTEQFANINRIIETTNNKLAVLFAKMGDTSDAVALKEIRSEMDKFVALSKQMGDIEIKIGGLEASGGNTNQIAALNQELAQLESTYDKLMSSFWDKLSSSADKISMGDISAFDDEILQIRQNVESQLSLIDAKVEDTKLKLATSIQAKIDSGNISSTIAKLTAQYEKLGATGHDKLSLVKADLAELERLQTVMNSSTDPTALASSYKEYNAVLLRVKNSLATISAESKTFVSSLQINTLDNSIANWLQKNSKASKDFGASIQDLRNRLAQLNISGNATRSQLDAIEQEFREIQVQAQLAGKTGVSFGNQLSGAFKSILRYVSVSSIIYQAINAIRQMYDSVVNINSKMVELRKVTNETDATYDKFLDNANKKAKKLGTTVSDLVASTADFARLGYSMSDAEYLAEVANIYAVVGDEIEDIDTATKSLISTMTAFKVDTSDAMTIVDKFNEVGNKFAISSGGIGEALERSSASLAAANNTLDESIALITAANTVVQDADTVGTAFKTISMRIRGAKTELEEAGLETDGMAESTATLRNELLALSGVDIMIDEHTFKSTYDILDELSKKWQNLTDIQQASITELIAGKRQGQVVSAVMTNFDIARKVVSTSESSEGSASIEHEKWMESLEAKINQLAASWENLSQAFLEDDFLANLIDTGSGVLDVLTKLVDTIGLFGVAIAGVGIYAFIKNFD